MKSEASPTSVLELLNMVLRSWWTVVAGISFGLAGAVLALHYMPKTYEASTKIWISQQQLPESVVHTTVNEDMSRRLLAFKDSVLDQPYMIELIDRTFGLPETEPELRRLIGWVRNNVDVQPTRAKQLGLLSFEVTYRDTDPQRAADVVNTLTRLYIDQNSKFRKGRAVNTAETVAAMAEEAAIEYGEIDARLQRFAQQHQFETQSHLDANLKLLDARQRDVEINQSKQMLTEHKLNDLGELLAKEVRRASFDYSVEPTGETMIDPLTAEIARVKDQLDDLAIVYSEKHPEYIKKLRELEDLLSKARNRRPAVDESGLPVPAAELPDNPSVQKIQADIVDVERELTALQNEQVRLRKDIKEYERRISVYPDVQRQLSILEEDHAVLREKYRKLQRDAERSAESIDLEDGKLGQRLEVLEYAGIPSRPVAPRPELVYIFGLMVGLGLFLGPMVIQQLRNPVISSESGLRSLSECPVLVTVPSIVTQKNQGASRRRLLTNLGFSLASSVVLVITVVFLG